MTSQTCWLLKGMHLLVNGSQKQDHHYSHQLSNIYYVQSTVLNTLFSDIIFTTPFWVDTIIRPIYRPGSRDSLKLNPLYKFTQLICGNAGTGTLICALGYSKIVLSHQRKLDSRLMTSSRYLISKQCHWRGIWLRVYTQYLVHCQHPAKTFPSEMTTNLTTWVLSESSRAQKPLGDSACHLVFGSRHLDQYDAYTGCWIHSCKMNQWMIECH